MSKKKKKKIRALILTLKKTWTLKQNQGSASMAGEALLNRQPMDATGQSICPRDIHIIYYTHTSKHYSE